VSNSLTSVVTSPICVNAVWGEVRPRVVEVEICGNGVRRGKGVPARLASERRVVGVKLMPTDR
jgi:hypothetical protein